MTDTDRQGDDKPRWLRDLQDAMDRASAAFQTAWESTKEERASALEAAKSAAKELGDVFDQGISAARKRWDSTPSGTATTEEE